MKRWLSLGSAVALGTLLSHGATAAPAVAAVPSGTTPAGGPQTSSAPRGGEATTLMRAAGLLSRHGAEVIRSLTDDVGPRPAGSPGDRAAVAWALRTLSAEGFANVHAEPVRVTHWVRGDESATLLGAADQRLAVTALGGSVGTPPAGIEGDVVELRSLAALKALGPSALTGKVAFLNVPTARARDGAGYGETTQVRWGAAVEARKRGAVAVVIRSVGTDRDRLPHTGAMQRDADPGAVPAAALSAPDADLVHRTLEAHGHARLRLKLGCQWAADESSANVVAEVRGEGRADEVVLLGAHLDSWDLGTGAVDDGAGVGIVVEAARLVQAYGGSLRRTLRVVLFANEEHGLDGGRAYATAHASEVAKIVAALEADFGTGRPYAARALTAPSRKGAWRAVAAPLASLGIELLDKDAHGGADLSPLRKLGVPMLDVAQDGTTYFDLHHTANDTFDKIDPEGIARTATAVALLSHGVLQMDGDLGRAPDSVREGAF